MTARDQLALSTALDLAPAADRDCLTVLRHSRNALAKTWRAGGALSDYDDPKYFQREDHHVGDVRELSALLTQLATRQRACVIRGRYVGDEIAARQDPEHRPGKTRRTKAVFEDQPLHTMLIDVDGFVPLAADPVLDPVAAIAEYVATMLPEPFQGASLHWQLSNSAGHPKHAGKLKAHLWFWLETAYTSAQLRAWAKALGSLDASVYDPIQIHYTAAPVFEPGVADPVPVRSGFTIGSISDSVDLVIDPDHRSAVESRTGKAQRRLELTTRDIPLQRMSELGMVKGRRQQDEGYNIVCPNDAQHTGESGETSTVYYLPNTGGFARRHFECKHAHCQDLTDEGFLQLLGIDDPDGVAADFDAEPAAPEAAGRDRLPGFLRDKRGAIESTVANTVAALRRADVCGFRIGHDAFRDEITVAPAGTDGHRPMTDADLVRIRIELERLEFKAAPKELVRDAAVLVAAENAYDSAQLWLGGLVHDGTPRVDTFLPTYMGTADTPYTRAVGRYMWSALAGRVLSPGVKADMVPIYEGDQGLRKSSSIEALAPAPDFFTEIDLGDKEDDSVRKLRGVLVAEIAELSGLHTRDLESIKKFISRTHEKWVPKYREFATTFARRLLFIGTTNRTDLLGDETGNRRWLPVHVTRADADAIARDREQLWAEGMAIFRMHGVCWQDAERLAPREHDAYTLEDTWADAVAAWLAAPDALESGQLPRGALPFTTAQALLCAVHISPKEQDRRAANRMGAILRTLGYVQSAARIEGAVARAWKKRA